jgi:Mn-dependent DtxR family transcriptional regulator
MVSKRQLEYLAAIASHWQAYGYAPSMRDMGRLLGVQVHAVDDALRILRRKGLVHEATGLARTLRLTAAGAKLIGRKAA